MTHFSSLGYHNSGITGRYTSLGSSCRNPKPGKSGKRNYHNCRFIASLKKWPPGINQTPGDDAASKVSLVLPEIQDNQRAAPHNVPTGGDLAGGSEVFPKK